LDRGKPAIRGAGASGRDGTAGRIARLGPGTNLDSASWGTSRLLMTEPWCWEGMRGISMCERG